MKTLFPDDLDKHTEFAPWDDGVAIAADEMVSVTGLDMLVALARDIYGVSAAYVSIRGRQYQWFLTESGMQTKVSPIENSICHTRVDGSDQLFVGDTHTDSALRKNPFVTGPQKIRFCAGIAIQAQRLDRAEAVYGTFCIADTAPRDAGTFDISTLRTLASLAETIIVSGMTRSWATLAAQKQADMLEKLNRNERLFTAVERMADMGSWRHDLVTDKTEWSKGVYAIHGLAVADGVPKGDKFAFYPEEERPRVEKILAHTLKTGEPFDEDFDFRTASGSRKRVRNVGELEYRDGKPCAIIGLFTDITAQYAMQKALRQKALTDPLTGLPNRAGFHVHINDILLPETINEHLGLLVIDLDGFKQVNDRAGHLAGDRALADCARIIRETVGESGFAARYGGDEFVILLTGSGVRAHSEHIANEIARNLSFSIYQPDEDAPLQIGATVGIAYNRTGDAVHEIIHRADVAMYEAKRARPGSVRTAASE